MMYRHYKGNYYFTLSLTTYLEDSKGLVHELEKRLRATHTETGEIVDVFMSNVRFYVLNEKYAQHVLYISADGRLWLRPREMFFGTLEDGTKRFELVINNN